MRGILSCYIVLLIASLTFSATPFLFLNNDMLHQLDYFDYYILTDMYELAFPDSFTKAETEFDKKDVTERLIPIADSIKAILLKKTFIVKDDNFTFSEYDFQSKSFTLNYRVLSIERKWKENFAKAFRDANKALSGQKVTKIKEKTPDTLFIRGGMGYGQVNMFLHAVTPVDMQFVNQVKTGDLTTVLPVHDEAEARRIARWNAKREYYDYNTPKGVYIVFEATSDYFEIGTGQAVITKPSAVLMIDEDKKPFLLFDFYKGKAIDH